MIALEDLKLTEKEFKIRKIWKYLILANYVILILTVIAVSFFTKDRKLFVAVSFILGLASIGLRISFYCAYRNPGVWWLRFGVLGLGYQIVKQVFKISAIIYCIFTIKHGVNQDVLWGTFLGLFVITLFSFFDAYVSYRLIYINKKIQCTKYLNQNEMNDLSLLKSSNDSNERAAIYNKLTTRNTRMQWFFKRIWKNKKVLITRW